MLASLAEVESCRAAIGQLQGAVGADERAGEEARRRGAAEQCAERERHERERHEREARDLALLEEARRRQQQLLGPNPNPNPNPNPIPNPNPSPNPNPNPSRNQARRRQQLLLGARRALDAEATHSSAVSARLEAELVSLASLVYAAYCSLVCSPVYMHCARLHCAGPPPA